MSWDRIVLSRAAPGEALLPHIERLLEQQRATWPALREGEAALQHLQVKSLADGGDTIVVQANPARRRSTHAQVDARSIAARPCFLCPENMPAEERGVAFEELVVLPNPYPILPWHCTVADRRHRPQQLAGNVERLLALAAGVGPELVVFYNGPRCGASAPDHLHFQACSATAAAPICELLRGEPRGRRSGRTRFGRSMLLFSGGAADVGAELERAVAALADLQPADGEPMVNVLVHHGDGRYVAALFPRRAHRPRRYFATGPERLAISPAALEMAGVLVAADVEDFHLVDAAAAREIYQEVSLDGAQFAALAARLGIAVEAAASGEAPRREARGAS